MAHVPSPRLFPALVLVALASACVPAAGSPPAVVPLLRVEPAPGEPSPDLDALLGWLGDAPLVGLGENPHGVHEHHRLAHRLFAHSHAGGSPHEPFGVFALEVDQAHAARLDDWVQGRRDDLDALLAERWYGSRIFYDQALADLLRWMRQHNRTAERPVHVAGYDLKQPALALDAVEEGLRRIDPALTAQARALREPILALGGYGLFPNVRGYTASVTLPLPPAGPAGRTRRVSAEVWVRGEGGDHGNAGMLATGVGAGSGEARKSHDLALPEIDGAWTPIRIHLSLPATMEEAQVWLYHRGNGVVWFDRLGVEVDGRPLGPPDLLDELEPWDLMMPKIQVMDYTAARDPSVAAPGGATPDEAGSLPALRVTCDPRIDRALEAARRLETLVAAAIDAAGDDVSPSDAAWTVQMARLVVQAVHWRTLVENNRDVFLAENVTWLRESGFPDRRVLALGHQAHTEPFPRRMGSFLAGRYGDRYATVTLHAEAGTYAYFGDVAILDRDAPLELHDVEEAGRRELVPVLAAPGEGNLLVNLERLASSAPQALAAVADTVPRPDAAVLLRRVTPARVPGEVTGRPLVRHETAVVPGATDSTSPPHVEPHVAVDPENPSRLVAAVMEVSEDRWQVRAHRSTDGGRTWRRQPLPIDPGVWKAFDPWLAWAPDGSALYLALVTIHRRQDGGQDWRLPVLRSTDGGATWTDWARVPGRTLDRPVLLAGDDAVYVLASEATSEAAIVVTRSADDGGGFEPVGRYTPPRNGDILGDAALLADGRVVVLVTDRSGLQDGRAHPLHAVTFDPTSGSFGEPRRLGEAVFRGAPMLATAGAADDGGERLHAVWVDASPGGTGIRHATSGDGGRTWSEPAWLPGTGADDRHRTVPSLAADGRGRVAVTWREHDGAPPSACSTLRAAISTDGGATFPRVGPVSSEPSCPDRPPNRLDLGGMTLLQRWPGGGDYLGLAVGGDGAFHPVWTDARHGPYRLWTATVE